MMIIHIAFFVASTLDFIYFFSSHRCITGTLALIVLPSASRATYCKIGSEPSRLSLNALSFCCVSLSAYEEPKSVISVESGEYRSPKLSC